jgi:hypothetical protein
MEDFMIPQDKRDAVSRGLSEAFGVTDYEDISRITRGHTPSLVFRIIVRGSPYLLKIITRAEDQTRHYANMRVAAAAGVAPRVLYASIPDHVSITDFVASSPLSRVEALAQLPALLRTLHALPPFVPAPFNTTCTFLLDRQPAAHGFLQRFLAANILTPAESAEFSARLAELTAVYPYGDAETVPCHNDLFKPDNTLFDGSRLWLVDWEAAFPNDRYADLAVVANLVVTNDDEERAFLRDYFGIPPGEYQSARLWLMRQLTHLFYTMAFLQLGAMGKPVDSSEPVPDFLDYQRRIWAGEVDVSDNAVKIVSGRVHWARLLDNVRQPRYSEALRIVSAGHPAS